MQNLRKKIDVTLINNKNKFWRWTSKPSYVVQKLFGNNLVAINNIKTTTASTKPEYVGMFILELREVPMYGFLHD